MLGVTDNLMLRIVEKYRYKTSITEKRLVLKHKINLMEAEEGDQQEPPRKRGRRLKHVYLINKTKYWTVVTDEELKKTLDVNHLDEKGHEILQHRIRK